MHAFTFAYDLTPEQIKEACSRFGLYSVGKAAMIPPVGVEIAFNLALSDWRYVQTVVKSLKSIFRTLSGRLASPDTVWSRALHKAGVPESGLSSTATLGHRLECLGQGDTAVLGRLFGPANMNVLHALVSKSVFLANVESLDDMATEPTPSAIPPAEPEGSVLTSDPGTVGALDEGNADPDGTEPPVVPVESTLEDGSTAAIPPAEPAPAEPSPSEPAPSSGAVTLKDVPPEKPKPLARRR